MVQRGPPGLADEPSRQEFSGGRDKPAPEGAVDRGPRAEARGAGRKARLCLGTGPGEI